MGRKKTAKKGDWKPIRVRPISLDKVRAAHKQNPTFAPELGTASDPQLLAYALDIAAWCISGELWKNVEKTLNRECDRARLDAAIRVAKAFGGTVCTNPNGSITVVKPGQAKPSTVPAPVPIQRPNMFN